MQRAKKSRNPEPPTPADFYTSLDVAQLTGVSLRQLQWWDEQGVVSPMQRGHKRLYQLHEVVEVSLITELRRKGVSLQRIRKVLQFVEKELGKRLFDVIRNGNELHLLTDGKNLYLEQDHSAIVNRLKNARQPMISVCLSDQIRRLTAEAGLKKGVGSERRSAAARSSRAS